ncbi:hypothetical protein Q73_04435 [Bacillus coahuilensis m2-6]|nr:hypothetical protein Q73_04435 [Bacillus coahuilensis m2-6]
MARSVPTSIEGHSERRTLPFGRSPLCLEGLAAEARHEEKRSRLFRGVWIGGVVINIKETK